MNASRKRFRKGRPLLVRELHALPNGAWVFVTYQKEGESRLRMNKAYQIERIDDDLTVDPSWMLGASVADFTLDPDLAPDAQCWEDTGDGDCYLFVAEPVS